MDECWYYMKSITVHIHINGLFLKIYIPYLPVIVDKLRVYFCFSCKLRFFKSCIQVPSICRDLINKGIPHSYLLDISKLMKSLENLIGKGYELAIKVKSVRQVYFVKNITICW